MNGDTELPAGWLTQFRRGVLSGAGLLLLAVGLCSIPTILVWLVPGADTSPASAAVKAAALLALAAPHGGIQLDGSQVTLTPLLVTIALGWLVAGQARRSESWSSVIGLAAGYAIASGPLAKWATLGATRAPVARSMLAALLFVALVGGVARAAEDGWPRVPLRGQQVLRAAAVAVGCYLLAGSLLAAGLVGGHFQDAVGMQRQLAPGAAGLPIAMLGVAATPNAVLAAVGYLTGPGFQLGTHTSVSAISVEHGPLPIFPLLAGVPHGRPAMIFGLLTILLVALLAGWAVLRVIAESDSWTDRLADAAAAAVLSGGLLAGLSALASGRVGNGALRGVGPVWWAVGVSTVLVLLFGAAVWLIVEQLRGRPATVAISRVYEFRHRSESASVAKPAEPESEPGSRSRQVG